MHPDLQQNLSGGVGLVRWRRFGLWDEAWDGTSTPARNRVSNVDEQDFKRKEELDQEEKVELLDPRSPSCRQSSLSGTSDLLPSYKLLLSRDTGPCEAKWPLRDLRILDRERYPASKKHVRPLQAIFGNPRNGCIRGEIQRRSRLKVWRPEARRRPCLDGLHSSAGHKHRVRPDPTLPDPTEPKAIPLQTQNRTRFGSNRLR